MSDKPESDSPTAQRVIASIEAVEIDLKAMARASIRRVDALKYPTPARRAQADMLIGSIERPARDLVFQGDVSALNTLLRKFEHDAMVLTQPLPVPSWNEHIEHWCKFGWTAKELDIDHLWSHLDGGRGSADRIAAISENELTLVSGKVITRAQLGLRPYVKPIMRVSAGPPHMIGQVIAD
jgi:hypothetical protein